MSSSEPVSDCVSASQHERSTDERPKGGAKRPQLPATGNAVIGTLAAMVCTRPKLFKIVRLMKKMRTKVALLIAAWCLVEGLLFSERPLSLIHIDVWVVIGVALIFSGLAFRLFALGCIRKKESLAIDGVYSLCRHPLYLGSILLAYGFCVLLADVENYVLATLYFVMFYPLTIAWEEIRLEALYGEAHRLYRTTTPLLLPLGTSRKGAFSWHTAMSGGGLLLLATVVMFLASIQFMASYM